MIHPSKLSFPILLFLLYTLLVIVYTVITQPYLQQSIIGNTAYVASGLHSFPQATLFLQPSQTSQNVLTIEVDDAGAGLTSTDITLNFPKSLTISSLIFTNSACSSTSHATYSTPGILTFSCTLAQDKHRTQISTLAIIQYTSTQNEPSKIEFAKETLLRSDTKILFYRSNNFTVNSLN